MNVYLIGYRGTGKSLLAPLVAAKLGAGWSTLDMDAELERRFGRTIAQFFEAEGEAAFREREAQLLAELDQKDQLVVATGGGVVERCENRAVLQRGYVAWLSARPETIDHRLRQDPTTASRRPNLLRRGGIDEIRAMASARAPWYRQLAHLALETDDGSPDEIAESIVAAFKRQIQDQAKANVQAN